MSFRFVFLNDFVIRFVSTRAFHSHPTHHVQLTNRSASNEDSDDDEDEKDDENDEVSEMSNVKLNGRAED
jgi:hypothetical protein